MNTTVAAALATELATLTAIAPTPTEPFGYGSDLSCDTDLDAVCTEVSGSDVLALGQAIFRRWITFPGRVPDDLEYGAGCWGILNRGTTAAELAMWEGILEAEALKDDRVNAIEVHFDVSTDGKQIDLAAAVTPNDPAVYAFSMTVAALSDGTLMLERISTS